VGFLLMVSRIYLPRSVRKRKLSDLFHATADAFQCEPPSLKSYSLDGYLTEYAQFTREHAELSIRYGNEHEVKERLCQNALRIGEDLREELKIRTLREAMQACEVIYKALKIEFHGDLQGKIHIRRCFFSSFYSGEVCRIISSLDEGLLAGLSGELALEFSQRITEGSKCCTAHLLASGSSS
jgi:hypothetical protein